MITTIDDRIQRNISSFLKRILRVSTATVSAVVLGVFLIIFVNITCSNNAFAVPNITGVTGTLDAGSQITVTGTGFGTKAKAAPFLWDNFESGTVGSSVAGNKGWLEYRFGPSHKYTDTTAYSGKLSSQNHSTTSEWFEGIGQKGLNSDQVYVSFYTKWRKYSGDYAGSTVTKFFRMNSQPDFYTSRPSFFVTMQPRANWCYANVVNGAIELTQQDLNFCPTDGGAWGRFEFYMKLSTPGLPDGAANTWWNYRQNYSASNAITRAAGLGGQHLDNFLMPSMNDERGGNVFFDYYLDDVYVDTTQARVEICDTPTWATRTHCEVQIPSAWVDSSITISTNLTNFSNGSTLYLYVVDANGNVNPTGFHKGLAAPTGLKVE